MRRANCRSVSARRRPELGDVSDEDADEDGALIVAGYASLTAIRGPHEDDDPALDGLLHPCDRGDDPRARALALVVHRAPSLLLQPGARLLLLDAPLVGSSRGLGRATRRRGSERVSELLGELVERGLAILTLADESGRRSSGRRRRSRSALARAGWR